MIFQTYILNSNFIWNISKIDINFKIKTNKIMTASEIGPSIGPPKEEGEKG